MVAVLRSSGLDTRLTDGWEGCQVPLIGGSSCDEGKMVMGAQWPLAPGQRGKMRESRVPGTAHS
jgi:hypothetical protein